MARSTVVWWLPRDGSAKAGAPDAHIQDEKGRNQMTLSLALIATAACTILGEEQFDSSGAMQIDLAVAPHHLQQTGPEQNQASALAGGESWTALGPFGGDVHDVARSPISPDIMLAGVAPAGSTGGALFRSTDGGTSWSIVPGLTSTSVYDIEFAPDGTAYIGSIDSIWKSTNSGASFTSLSLGIGLNDQVFDVAINPGDANELWIAIADAIGNQPVNVMKSTSAGAAGSWVDVTPPMGVARSGRAIAINPKNPQEVYVGFIQGQLWMSASGGAAGTWVNRSAGLPNAPINGLAHDGGKVMVCGGQLFGGQNFGLFESINQGATWTAVHSGPPAWPSLVINDVALDPNDPQTRHVVTATQGVFRSEGGGAWEFGAGGTGALSLNAVVFGPGSSTDIMLAANAVGVLQSVDSGDSYSITSSGISKLNVVSIASNPLNVDELAIAFQGANDGGVYASTDGGQSWALQTCPPTRYGHVQFAPDGALYALSTGPIGPGQEGVYRRNPDQTWTLLGPDQGALFESNLASMRFSETDPNLMFAVGADFGVAGSEGTIWRNDNAGAVSDWVKVYEGATTSESVTDLRIVSGSGDQTMIASWVDNSSNQFGGVLRSATGGGLGSWSPSVAGLPATVQGRALSSSPESPSTFLLGHRQSSTVGGLFRTTDAGQSWTSTGFTGPVQDVVADPNDAQTIYIMQQNATAVFRSEDAGANFAPFNAGLSFSGFATDLAYASGAGPRLLLSTSVGSFAIDLPRLCGPGDITCSGNVDVDDLLAVINGWGLCDNSEDCPADIAPAPDGNGIVDVDDLLMVINNWG